MCGRYTLTANGNITAEFFGLDTVPELRPRYNITPSQLVAVVGNRPEGQRGLTMLNWGLVCSWENDPEHGFKPINARAETLRSKPMFRELIESKRCLIATDGFYEWRKVGTKKIPNHIRLKGGGPMAFAGLWDIWDDGTRRVRSCCIITTEANDLVKSIHDRMPVIVPPDRFAEWLDADSPAYKIDGLLLPFPAEAMEKASRLG